MSVPVLTFFNNKGGVGKTSLVYHLSWILSEMGKKVVAVDLDPQANLTSAFLPEEELEDLWDSESPSPKASTIYRCVQPLMEAGDIQEPITRSIRYSLHLVPGDLALAGFEDFFRRNGWLALQRKSFACVSRFDRILDCGSKGSRAASSEIFILADVGL